MKWSVPYVSGGLADQNVMLLRCFDILNNAKYQHEKEESDKRERESKKPRTKTPSGGRRGRRR
jgi:hypothetical protein